MGWEERGKKEVEVVEKLGPWACDEMVGVARRESVVVRGWFCGRRIMGSEGDVTT